MRFREVALASSIVVLGAVTASAQTTTTVKITGAWTGSAGVTSGGAPSGSYPAGTPNFYISPYAGLIDYDASTKTGQKVSLNCVDYFHHVSVGNVWTVNVTNLGAAAANNSLLSTTRYGSVAPGSSNLPNVLNLYKQAAWLTLQYDPNPASSPNKTRAIQSAIWALFNPLTVGAEPWFNGDGPSTYGMFDSQWWVAQAGLAQNALSNSELKYFSILTDNTYPQAAGSAQEFVIHVTPEPGTVVLMLTGLAAVILVVRRRRSAGLNAA